MIPRLRAWDKEFKEMVQVDALVFDEQIIKVTYKNGNVVKEDLKNYVLMQSTGLTDKNGKEIFEGDILKFNDEWAEYCYEGYVDGVSEGINFVEIEKDTTCFGFGKTKIPESSLFNLVNDEHLTFKELITDTSFEFEIIGNIHTNPELLEVSS
jgi:uncharacterized phage protein (TIGR01671 family)|nr:MAG TPA: YopX protein [Caudoviricetes sp.]